VKGLNRPRLIGLPGRPCRCGAKAEEDSRLCRKCRDRQRWRRRKAWRR
jgi:hypothetical protein